MSSIRMRQGFASATVALNSRTVGLFSGVKQSFVLAIAILALLCAAPSHSFAKERKSEKESSNVPTISGPVKKNLLLKPFLIFGYNLQEIFTHPNTATAPFFTELSVFQNWRVGIGLRITSFVGLELAYNSLARTYHVADHKISNSVTIKDADIDMFTHMVYFVGTFYTPAIDLKFGTLEFTASIGIAGLFGLNHMTQLYDIPVTSMGPQFMGGLGVIFGFPKFVSIKGFAEVVTLGQNIMNIPFAMNYGIAINIYLL